MGLCKCPKKKVTNQFCFEHRVNVCEHCMVTNHPKCIVQSYLQWLQDSDYNPICEICNQDLSVAECVRLICYHVFHWECLNELANTLPSHTAPAGYTCPNCKVCIFPAPNLISPVAECLRQMLVQVNWARTGLGLPLIESSEPSKKNILSVESSDKNLQIVHSTSINIEKSNEPKDSKNDFIFPQKTAEGGQTIRSNENKTNNFQRTEIVYSSVITGPNSPRKLYDATEEDSIRHTSFDHDENKYRRRSAFEWFSRWFKSQTSSRGSHDPHRKFKKYLMIAVLIIIGLFTVIVIFIRVGRATAENDPLLDPKSNPHLRVDDA